MRSILLLLLFCFSEFVFAQDCPQNLGFELGNFSNWSTYYGFASSVGDKNVITKNFGNPMRDRHSIISSTTAKDYYGDFPVLAPNGSGYSVKLGNDGVGSNAEGLTYKIKVPENRSDFVLSYQYAVVFQDPSHTASQQPRFNAKVLDLSTNEYINCASFEYIATSSLPGFKKSTKGNGVLYKDWTTVTLDLSGYQGKEIVLEFTTADCTPGAHFGYAYIDVHESCNGIVKGNEICKSATNVVLTGPAGYKDYIWYNENRTIRYGSGEVFSFNRVFSNGTRILLDLVPYEGFGCTNTINTVIIEKEFVLGLLPEMRSCINTKVDLLSPNIILNKQTGINYLVYFDDKLTRPVLNPHEVSEPGRYYIKATNLSGCHDIKFIDIYFEDYFADIEIVREIKICKSDFVNLTSSNVLNRIPDGAILAYYSDRTIGVPLSNPTKVGVGTYYIVATKNGCNYMSEVNVSNFDVPLLKVVNPAPFCANIKVDLNSPQFYVGSTLGMSYSFFIDNNWTMPVSNSDRIGQSGKYYIRAKDRNGCVVTGSIDIVIESPVLVAIDPNEVCYPSTVDITSKMLYQTSSNNVVFSYYDEQGRLLEDPKSVKISGNYKVVITNPYGCTDSKWIKVKVHPLPIVKISNPKKTLEPYTVDITKKTIVQGSGEYDRVEYFEDAQLTVKVSNPDRIAKGGVYYIAFYNAFGCVKVGVVNVVIGKKPLVVLPTAFTPLLGQNNRLYPFPTSINKLVSFKVFNKWGNLVFETSSLRPEDGWDGYYRGKLQPFETYTWYVEAVDEIGERYNTKGKTILMQ